MSGERFVLSQIGVQQTTSPDLPFQKLGHAHHAHIIRLPSVSPYVYYFYLSLIPIFL